MKLDNLILSPTGRQMYEIGNYSHAQFTEGDYCVSIEWHQEGRSCEPVMVIWPKYGGRNAGAFGICRSSIDKYVTTTGTAEPEGLLECWKALPTLGRNQIDMECFRLMDLVVRHTPDLLRCPPMPPAMRREEAGQPLLECTRIVNGKRVEEVEI